MGRVDSVVVLSAEGLRERFSGRGLSGTQPSGIGLKGDGAKRERPWLQLRAERVLGAANDRARVEKSAGTGVPPPRSL
jgi:hypothetical protein